MILHIQWKIAKGKRSCKELEKKCSPTLVNNRFDVLTSDSECLPVFAADIHVGALKVRGVEKRRDVSEHGQNVTQRRSQAASGHEISGACSAKIAASVEIWRPLVQGLRWGIGCLWLAGLGMSALVVFAARLLLAWGPCCIYLTY